MPRIELRKKIEEKNGNNCRGGLPRKTLPLLTRKFRIKKIECDIHPHDPEGDAIDTSVGDILNAIDVIRLRVAECEPRKREFTE